MTWAKLNEDNVVTQVIYSNDNHPDDEKGYSICRALGGTWIETSPEAMAGEGFRKNFATVGSTYDYVKDAFIPNQPYASWLLNNTTYTWEAPIPYPEDNKVYIWNENTKSWDIKIIGTTE
jgi:hypothetical protein